MVQPYAGVERQNPRRGFLMIGNQAVFSAIRRRKGRMRLKDKIRLPGKP